ncbi:copper resistance protein NlpE [Flavobacterium sp. SM15]|uniref:copper resistance protein NlpE n=1 Tax=Flavobacterium sp. SM15 TaxID=2908005 RepID=UPI001EDA66DB|nr:copper resistance protein NlpE [Flavobacterium sp. SM15]MCG2612284.1 copper resistance protein NlpE [Flavobacterium sp. SM15]
MKQTFLALTFLSFVLTGCKKEVKTETESAATVLDSTASVPDSHTSENALDWNGSYQGVVPCADCPGIETKLTLNKDKTYELSVLYQDREKQPTITKGNFTFDQSGSIITLDKAGKTTSYKIKEGCLTMLDRDKKEIGGALKAKYILNKNH